MAFGVRNNPGGTTLYACPGCEATFPDTPKGRAAFRKHIKDVHGDSVPQ